MIVTHKLGLSTKERSLLVFVWCLVFLASVSVRNGFAQSGQNVGTLFTPTNETPAFIDDNFKPVLTGPAATINRTLVQPDGKILVAGLFHSVNGTSVNGVARFHPNGTLDTTFNTKSGVSGTISALGLQSDGKIIIAGSFTSYSGQQVGNIARLNPDGSFDLTFNWSPIGSSAGAPGINNTIIAISVLPDNRILVGGNFTSYNGSTVSRLMRLTINGDLDTAFSVGTGPNSTVNVIKQLPDGKILIGGDFSTYNGNASARLAGLNSDGSYDSSFSIGTGANSTVRTFAVQPDGKIIVGGNFSTLNGVARNGIARLNSDGTNDATFTVSGTGAKLGSIALQSDGKLIVGGTFTAIAGTTQQSIARLNADGTFDSTFSAGTGLSASGSINELTLQSDGKVVFVGAFTSYNGTARSGIARANTDGTLEAGLNPTAAQVGVLFTAVRQPDGKILLGGTFSSVNGTPRANIARVNADGTLDTSFDPGTGANNTVQSIGVQPNGRIIISGGFASVNGNASKGIARLNADGSFDTSFVVGTGLNFGQVDSYAFQSDGKILIGGTFTTYNSVAANSFARLNADGSLDTSFAVGTAANGEVRRIIVQPDGKILIAGYFITFNGNSRSRIARLNPDGTDDATFNAGTGPDNRVYDMIQHNDGRIVIVGMFAAVNGTARKGAARLNADGSLDSSFDPGVGFVENVMAIAALPDGKYMVGGIFTTASGLPRNRLARLRADGSLDPKFLSGLGPSGATSPQIRFIVPNNGKFLVGGTFEIFNTSARSALVQMSNASKVPCDFDGDGITDYAIARQYGGIGRWTWWIRYSSKGEVFSFDFGIFGVDALQPGDFDGDGRTDVAVWRTRAATGSPNAYWINFSTTNTVKNIPFGLDGDRPVLEDYDGDGKDDMALYRAPATTVGQGVWYYLGSFNNPNNNLSAVPWGMRFGSVSADQTDEIYPGDFNGDGRADFRVQRMLDTSRTVGDTPAAFYTLLSTGEISYDYMGWASDRTIPGDYDGDGKTDLAISRGFNRSPSITTWYIRYTGGSPDAAIQWGAGTLDNFVQGDYDGDGITDIAVYRRANENVYYILRSSDQTMMTFQFGTADPDGGPASDVPIATFNNR